MFLDKHVKTFVRPFSVKNVKDPHTYKLYNPNRYFAIDGKPKKESPFHNIKKVFTQVPAYIAHYYIQSEEEHLRRKGRELDDGSSKKDKMHPEVHKVYNDVLNNQLQNKYSKNIKQYLQKYNIVL
jgi:hypothetical protein